MTEKEFIEKIRRQRDGPCFCNKENRLEFNRFFFDWLEKNKDKI